MPHSSGALISAGFASRRNEFCLPRFQGLPAGSPHRWIFRPDASGPQKHALTLPRNSRAPNGVRVTVAREWALTIDEISGADVNGAGAPDVVFDAFTGGEH